MSSEGSTACWTCKLRRKKCNKSLPTCHDCTLLEIECHYSADRPTWMDNGKEQHKMAETVKMQVKRNLAHRARRNKIRILSKELNNSSTEASPPESPTFSLVPELDSNIDAPWVSLSTPASHASRTESFDNTDTVQSESSGQDIFIPHEAETAAAYKPSDFVSSLLMSYLDYAFPVLFPFYKPPISEAGRGWLLALALKSPGFYHNIIGMAAYFFHAMPTSPGPTRDLCMEQGQIEMQTHMEKAVQGVQHSLGRVTRMGIHHSLAENILLLGNIVQLVNFEVVFATSANWQMHLTAAANLFDQTLRHFGEGCQGATKMSALLGQLRGVMPPNCSFWSVEQAALRFFAATLIHQDVIAGTAHEKTPNLHVYYDELLATPLSLEEQSHKLHLENFTGCPNWVVRSIAETSSLKEWKENAKRAGSLDILDLVQRATLIQTGLREGVARLGEVTADALVQTQVHSYQALESILARSNITKYPTATLPSVHCTISKIWAHAVEVYLITVLSGWQPSNIQLRTHVAQALEHLKVIDNPSWLRTLAWPFCILGCLAATEQEAAFIDIANASGGLAMFGTLRDALAIMQKVWSLRCQHNADTWDIAYCLRILGHSVLLV
ncbi:fungal-specific transcription factor domain-containing protein [Boeremia exigua]|uniref:fungal-specific transcription factor domain-containing protein n=1 Tax=Boeremia exigua TaxID=749465 RepID=UPI001E8EEF5B|nr:fungal-specific transcription factor domain-containing protein [Boeremia exigua]KAH6644395.1 fungal-specific transcription factor domain-containing protein [Boeremia exigua]